MSQADGDGDGEDRRALLGLAGELLDVGGWTMTVPDRELLWSDGIHRILELPPDAPPPFEEVLARYHPDDAPTLVAALDRCATDGSPFDLALRLETFAGNRRHVRAVGQPRRDGNGDIRQVVGALQDVTELESATRRAAALGDRLAATLESMSDAFFVLDHDWRFTYLNRRAGELLLRRPEGLLGRSVWDEFPEAVETAIEPAYRRAMDEQVTVSLTEYYAPLGTWFSISAYPTDDGLAVYFRDVTAAQQAQIELEQREHRLAEQAALLDQAQDAIHVRDLDGRVTFWSRGAERLYGWDSTEVLGRRLDDVVSDGGPGRDDVLAELLAQGRWHGELELVRRDGEVRTVEARLSLLRDEHGDPRSVLALDTDVTDRRRLEQQLLRAQRMESIGTLAGGIAHDLNNVLAPIMLAIDLLHDGEGDEHRRRLLETARASARRGSDLVAQVLSFARGEAGTLAEVSVASLLDEMASIARSTFPRNLRIEVTPPASDLVLRADATQLHQLLMNLFVNARDALTDGGTIRCRAEAVDLDESYVAVTPAVRPGRHAVITVEDDGPGMTQDVADRAFEPFFTTKAVGAGTGLGLSTCLGIVRNHGGHLQLYTEPGRGARFRIYLPCGAEVGEADPAAPAAGRPRGRGELVLVVDDEEAVLHITRSTLEAYGYRVVVARDGAEAVSVFARNAADVEVVLTDMMMPIMEGPATIRALRSIDPAVPIVAASGLQANGRVAKAAAAGVQHFLDKPYTADALLETIRSALDGEG